MKKIVILISILATVFMFGITSANAWTLSLETIGQETVIVGDTFTANLYFNADAVGNEIKTFGLAIGYDTSELAYDSATISNLSPLMALFGDVSPQNGYIDNFSRSSFYGTYSATGKTLLATITFTVLNGAGFDGDLDVWLYEGISGDGSMTVDGVTSNIFKTGSYTEGPDVGVGTVPVPGTLMLLGFGLVGFVGMNRRQ